MYILYQKLKEVMYSVLPIMLLVLLIHFTIAPQEPSQLVRFLIGSLLIIIGLAIFLFGVDISISPIGTLMGKLSSKTNQLWIIALGALLLGFFVSIAEPDLHVLSQQVDRITSGQIPYSMLVVVVSIGIAIFFSIGFIRILMNISLNKVILVSYIIVFILAIFSSKEFFAISFDASGATTGALLVPFMMAISVSLSAAKRNIHSMEVDSFGLVGITSIGAIISVIVLSILHKTNLFHDDPAPLVHQYDSIFTPFISQFLKFIYEIALALLPIFIVFIGINIIYFKLSKKQFYKIIKGLLYTYIGLVLFMVGINAGFMEVGSMIGFQIASRDNQFLLILIGFILGFFTIIAEPAVHILTNQIEAVTSGFIKRKVVLSVLSISIGLAVAFSMIRIVYYNVQLWHFIVPGYLIALLLTFFTPKLFVGIAFDSGGVASGPMTATFILAFAQGAAKAIEHADVLLDAFGVIAMVALTPLITLQILGLLYKRTVSGGGKKKYDELR